MKTIWAGTLSGEFCEYTPPKAGVNKNLIITDRWIVHKHLLPKAGGVTDTLGHLGAILPQGAARQFERLLGQRFRRGQVPATVEAHRQPLQRVAVGLLILAPSRRADFQCLAVQGLRPRGVAGGEYSISWEGVWSQG